MVYSEEALICMLNLTVQQVQQVFVRSCVGISQLRITTHYDSGSQPGVRVPPGVREKISRGTWLAVEFLRMVVFYCNILY